MTTWAPRAETIAINPKASKRLNYGRSAGKNPSLSFSQLRERVPSKSPAPT